MRAFHARALVLLSITLSATAALGATSLEAETIGSASPQSATRMLEQSEAHRNDANELGLVHNVGVHVGPALGSVSSTSLNPSPVTNSQTRLMFGASTTIGLGSIFYLQPELNFVQKGYEEPFTFADGSRSVTGVDQDFLEIPMLAKVRTNGSGKLRPFAVAGPSIGILLNSGATVTDTSATGSTTVRSQPERSNAFSPLALSAILGAGIEYELGASTALTASLRYSLALTNAEAWDDASGTTLRSVKNNAVQLLGGVQFAL